MGVTVLDTPVTLSVPPLTPPSVTLDTVSGRGLLIPNPKLKPKPTPKLGAPPLLDSVTVTVLVLVTPGSVTLFPPSLPSLPSVTDMVSGRGKLMPKLTAVMAVDTVVVVDTVVDTADTAVDTVDTVDTVV